MRLEIEEVDGALVLTVKVVPGSSRTAIAGVLDGMLKVKVAAPPEKGKANKALLDFLAGKLGVKKTTLSIIQGQTNPVKQVEVAGISPQLISEKLGLQSEQ